MMEQVIPYGIEKVRKSRFIVGINGVRKKVGTTKAPAKRTIVRVPSF